METSPAKEVPKHSCMITLMFAIVTDAQALAVKKAIDDAIKDIPEKRYNFQINET